MDKNLYLHPSAVVFLRSLDENLKFLPKEKEKQAMEHRIPQRIVEISPKKKKIDRHLGYDICRRHQRTLEDGQKGSNGATDSVK